MEREKLVKHQSIVTKFTAKTGNSSFIAIFTFLFRRIYTVIVGI